ncbi:MAG: thymidylate synthase, partial [Candidatus Methanofastidiosa archaeon]|nr:thymidylate synthase [Candidatus Methanofastidiosa archaeon]
MKKIFSFKEISTLKNEFPIFPTMNIENQYLHLVSEILEKGILKPNRTGVAAYTIVHAMLQHDMQDGYPLLTTKKVAFKVMAYASLNNPPAVADIASFSVLNNAGQQVLKLHGISDGDNNTQTLTITAVSSNPAVIPDPVIVYNQGDS